ncbi:MAG: hypothetical protein JJU36_15860, partial [Phycisphaeraceae bacterium]|nr:hypothetical protein [Phycisphaeraceae bacterium]
DRIMVTLLHDPDDESWHTLAGENGERFTFQSHAVIRAGNGEVRITGRLREARFRLAAEPDKVTLNGQEVPYRYRDGTLEINVSR